MRFGRVSVSGGVELVAALADARDRLVQVQRRG
jgi:hypothetical protein